MAESGSGDGAGNGADSADRAGATLRVERRAVLGKAVRRLRQAGVVPANVYGRGAESISIQAPLTEFRRVYRSVDRNAVVQMQIDEDAGTIPVVLREVQRTPVGSEVLHLDFYQVDLTRVIHSEARVVLTGASEAVSLGGTLVQGVDLIMLEALPMEMPSEITVDISGLDEFGTSVLVRDVELPDGVRAVTDGTVAVVTVLAPRVSEDEEEEMEGVEGEIGEAVEGEAVAAGDGEAEGADE